MKKTSTAIVLPLLMAFSAGVIAQSRPSVLFPEPLHMVREIEDPISGSTHVVEEFYAGNRAVSVSGEQVAIADYAEGTLTEIDRGAGTYSIATFEAIAEARRSLGGTANSADLADGPIQRQTLAPEHVAGRVAETFAAEFPDGQLRRVELSISSEIELSREAFDVISGAAFPSEPTRASRAAAALATRPEKGIRPASAGDRFRLPLRKVLVYVVDGEQLTVIDRTVTVDDAYPDPELLAIPPGAERVEPDVIRMQRLLEELDRLPGERK